MIIMLVLSRIIFVNAETYIVTNTKDTGAGSLRQAILDANSRVGPHTVVFNMAAGIEGHNSDTGVWTIRPQSKLPDINMAGTVIDGTSQTAYIGGDSNPEGPEIEIDGSQCGEVTGLILFSTDIHIHHIAVNRFMSGQIVVHRDRCQITGCYIGISATGDVHFKDQMGISSTGISVYSAVDVVIGGAGENDRNIISGNTSNGITLSGGSQNCRIENNYIGLNQSGSGMLGNYVGIRVSSQSRRTLIIGNVISGNENDGVIIQMAGTDSTTITGNRIGTNPEGTEPMGNGDHGLRINSGSYTVIGTSEPGTGNLISGNSGDGIGLNTASHSLIQGNMIGTDITGSMALPNEGDGIFLTSDCSDNRIGGTGEKEGNLISGNLSDGITLHNAGNKDNTIAGNFIGTDISGDLPIPNGGHGVNINNGARSNTIGPGNRIAFNQENGVYIYQSASTGNTVTRNSIWENGGMGIHLADNANGSIASPFITGIGPVTGTAPANASVEIYNSPDNEGKTHLVTVTADADGHFTWPGTPEGPWVTATATDADGNTSQFSDAFHIGPFMVTSTSDFEEGSLRWALENAAVSSAPAEIAFNIPQSDSGFNGTVWVIRPQSTLPHLTSDYTVIDGSTQSQLQGNTNPEGPEIMITGDLSSTGMTVYSSHNRISGLIISHFSDGIYFGDGSRHNTVTGCYIGTDAGGADTLGNGTGIRSSGSSHLIIGGPSTDERNVISGNHDQGISFNSTDSSMITNTLIGTDPSGSLPVPNGNYGMYISNYSRWNHIGPDNIIRFNGNDGIFVRSYSVYNTISQNSISNNGGAGIDLYLGGNREIPGPVITRINPVTGTTLPHATVEIFSDSTDEGRIYHGTVIAGSQGDFSWDGIPAGPYITATATDDSGNTSAFSDPKLARGLTVINTRDDGEGSLRWALQKANQETGPDTILFDIPESDENFDGTVWTIYPLTDLPVFTDDGTFVNGRSQKENHGETNSDGPEILLNGRHSTQQWSRGFSIQSQYNCITGFIISGFSSQGIAISSTGDHNHIFGNYIGSTANGTDTLSNGSEAIYLRGDNNVIGGTGPGEGNLISGNSYDGIYMWDADSNRITGNIIGLNAAGDRALPNTYAGISMSSCCCNTIGGIGESARNIISGNGSMGISLRDSGSTGNIIQGNYIGTDITGSVDLGNGSYGIQINGGASNNRIGGSQAGEGNVISGNGSFGIYIEYVNTDQNSIAGNDIGINAAGTAALPNDNTGIHISAGACSNQIGPANIVSGNKGYGVTLDGPTTTSNIISGNWVGLDASGCDTIPNHLHGIRLQNKTNNNVIGGPDKTDGNVISGNGWSGIGVEGDSTMNNVFRNNIIGSDTSGTLALGNAYHGIHLTGIGNTLQENLLSGNTQNGIMISNNATDNIIAYNRIGIRADHEGPLPNRHSGIKIQNRVTGTIIGPDNLIRCNMEVGIALVGSDVTGTTITGNSIARNLNGGILFTGNANNGIAAPVFTGIQPLSGTAPAGSTVEIFSDSTNQGRIYEGSVTADNSGNWTCAENVTGPNATATATDASGNTSEFSTPLIVSVEKISGSETPADFFLARNYPNPFNSKTCIAFGVKTPCRVTLKIYNIRGRETCTVVNDAYLPGQYQITFHAAGMSSGIYFYRIEMGAFTQTRKMLLLE